MRRRAGKRIKIFGLHVVIALISLAFAFPLLWMFMTSFKSPKEYYRMPPKFLPDKFHIFHYKEAFAPWMINPTEMSESTYWIEESAGRVEPVIPNIINSLIVIIGSVLLSLAVGIWAAYALSRFTFKGREQMSIWILSTRMMPPIVIAVPLFWVMKKIHLVGTHFGLILIYVMIQLPFVIWMMKGFFDEVPREMEESVLLDGGTRATCIFRVVLPMAFPGIVATALFCIFLTWTEFLFASIMTNTSSATLPVVLSWFRQDRGILWGQMSAVMVVSLIPLMTITMILQKKMIRGLTAGALK
jgi:multiple sugar transport system permease protein